MDYELWLCNISAVESCEANVIKTIQFPNLYLFLEQWNGPFWSNYITHQGISVSDQRRPETILDRPIYEIKSYERVVSLIYDMKWQ